MLSLLNLHALCVMGMGGLGLDENCVQLLLQKDLINGNKLYIKTQVVSCDQSGGSTHSMHYTEGRIGPQ